MVRSNPCDAVDRPKIMQGTARGLNGEQIQRLLEVLPLTPVGLRDRAIILTLTFTGRRRAEVLGMTAGSITFEGGRFFYSYKGKGGKNGRRELPGPAFEAIRTWLAVVGKDLATMPATASLWPDTRHGRGITSGTFTPTCVATSRRRDYPSPVSTSSGTAPPSSDATRASPSRRCRAFSTTAISRRPRHT